MFYKIYIRQGFNRIIAFIFGICNQNGHKFVNFHQKYDDLMFGKHQNRSFGEL